MIQVRSGIFETNSSSVHSLTMCTAEEFEKWKNGELLYCDTWNKENFVPLEEAEKIVRASRARYYPGDVDNPIVDEDFREENLYSYGAFWDSLCGYCEGFEESYTTPGGEEIVAFGYSGYDG